MLDTDGNIRWKNRLILPNTESLKENTPITEKRLMEIGQHCLIRTGNDIQNIDPVKGLHRVIKKFQATGIVFADGTVGIGYYNRVIDTLHQLIELTLKRFRISIINDELITVTPGTTTGRHQGHQGFPRAIGLHRKS